MVKQVISLNTEQAVVTIRAHADLAVKGWDQREIIIEGGNRHSTNILQEGNAISISPPRIV